MGMASMDFLFHQVSSKPLAENNTLTVLIIEMTPYHMRGMLVVGGALNNFMQVVYPSQFWRIASKSMTNTLALKNSHKAVKQKVQIGSANL